MFMQAFGNTPQTQAETDGSVICLADILSNQINFGMLVVVDEASGNYQSH